MWNSGFLFVWGKQMKKYSMYGALVILLLGIVATILGWRYYVKQIEKNEWSELGGSHSYAHHYVLIPDDGDSDLWQDIYHSAQKEAEAQDAYVELFQNWSAGDYSHQEYLEIAIAAKVDGIILKPDGTAKMRKLINEANAAGIPVITVLDDDTASDRKSFVGINSYQMGTTYGHQILECMDESVQRITVLLQGGDSGKELIFKELKSTVLNGLSRQQQERILIEPLTILSSSTFDAEEVIRDLLNNDAVRPDILVCMNETDSVSAYNAMVDYNLVGSIAIIGYYPSDTVLAAIEKGTIPMAVTLDAQQIGQRAVEALEEYYRMGYASSYLSVDLGIITSENVALYRQETDEQGGW